MLSADKQEDLKTCNRKLAVFFKFNTSSYIRDFEMFSSKMTYPAFLDLLFTFDDIGLLPFEFLCQGSNFFVLPTERHFSLFAFPIQLIQRLLGQSKFALNFTLLLLQVTFALLLPREKID